MKILVVCQYYYPEPFQITDICETLVKLGHKVTVLTGLPNYPEGKIPKEYKSLKKRNEIINGVIVKRSFEIGRHQGKVFLALNYISFAISGTLKAFFMREDFDLIFCYQLSPVTMVYPAIVYKVLKKAPLFLYCLDLWPESVQAHVSNDKGNLYKGIKTISKKIYNKCDKIAVTSEPFIEYLETVNEVPKDKLCYIPQHADTRMLNMDFSGDDNNIVDFMYAGNLGKGQDIETIIKAAGIIKDRNDFLIHIVGDGSNLGTLQELAKKEHVEDKIIFHGRYPANDMHKFYKLADALLITLRGNNFVSVTMPGKLQTYMTTGKPIFGAINGAAQTVVSKANCGECVDSGDYMGLANLMELFIENPMKYKDCGKNARKYFKENFTKETFLHRLQNELVKVVSKK